MNELIRKAIVVFAVLQLLVDVVGIIFLATLSDEADTLRTAMTIVIVITLVETIVGIGAMFWPRFSGLIGVRQARSSLALAVIAAGLETIALVALWGDLGIERTALLVILWVSVVVFTVADAIGSAVAVWR